MHYTPDYTIKLPEGEVHLLFNTGMFINYCEFKGIDYEDLIEQARNIKVVNLPDIIRFAADSYHATNNEQHSPYSKAEAYQWVDSMGGLNAMPLVDIYKRYVSKLIGVPIESIMGSVNTVEEPEGKKLMDPA